MHHIHCVSVLNQPCIPKINRTWSLSSKQHPLPIARRSTSTAPPGRHSAAQHWVGGASLTQRRGSARWPSALPVLPCGPRAHPAAAPQPSACANPSCAGDTWTAAGWARHGWCTCSRGTQEHTLSLQGGSGLCGLFTPVRRCRRPGVQCEPHAGTPVQGPHAGATCRTPVQAAATPSSPFLDSGM